MSIWSLESAVRLAMHQAGASALGELLKQAAPDQDQRRLPCPCGGSAVYQELRSKTILTAVGPVELLRPYYLCPDCHNSQFPADVELGIQNSELSPGVRRMLAVVGSSFMSRTHCLRLRAELRGSSVLDSSDGV